MSDDLAASVRELADAIRELARALAPQARAAPRPGAAVTPAPPRGGGRGTLSLDGPVANTDTGQAGGDAPVAPLDPLAEARAVVSEAFRLACADDDEAAFQEFVALFHTERMSPPRAVPTLREFVWRSIRRRAVDYLPDTLDPSTFEVARTEPAQLTPQLDAFRIFVGARARSATPVAFKRDPERQGALRLTDCSL